MQNECLFVLLRKRSQDEVKLEATANFAFSNNTKKKTEGNIMCIKNM